MSVQKYGVRDKMFYTKMRASAWNTESLSIAVIFELTGMHVWSMQRLTPESIHKEGGDRVLYWVRPKNYKTLNRLLPSNDVDLVKSGLEFRRKSRTFYWDVVKNLGKRAGFDDISPMTYRHQRCVWLLWHGYSVWEVPHIMGCDLDIVMKNYTKMKEWGEFE